MPLEKTRPVLAGLEPEAVVGEDRARIGILRLSWVVGAERLFQVVSGRDLARQDHTGDVDGVDWTTHLIVSLLVETPPNLGAARSPAQTL